MQVRRVVIVNWVFSMSFVLVLSFYYHRWVSIRFDIVAMIHRTEFRGSNNGMREMQDVRQMKRKRRREVESVWCC